MRGITIQADKTRTQRYSNKIMKEYKYARREEIKTSTAKMNDGVDFEFIRYMFYLGLKHEDKELTEEKTGEILDILFEEHGIEYVAELLGDAISKAFGIKETPGQSHSKNK